jgi:subtilisin family serine protease
MRSLFCTELSKAAGRAALVGIGVLLAAGSVWGQRMDGGRAARMLRQPHAEGQFIVKFREAAAPEAGDVERYARGRVRGLARIGEGAFHLLRTEAGGAEVLASLSEHPEVEWIEPNYEIRVGATPNDALFGQQWGLKNAATASADVAAVAAWDYGTGSRKTVVAVIDTGVDFNHPDLDGNIWTAPRAFTFNGAGGTVNCPAGSRGINAIASSCVPMDDNGHGTHCAGIIGAMGNNSSGVTGLNWTASILPVKFLGANGSGLLSDALRAIDAVVHIKKQFGAEANVRVISASWGFTGNSQSLEAALSAVNAADILFVSAAGNEGANNDVTASYPANSSQPNVIAVAATDRNDALAGFSNYGSKVHMAAPGVGIASTYRNGQYANMSGTSMAAPFVAGAAALLLGSCTADTAAVRGHLLASVDVLPSLSGKTASSGRLNVYKAVRRCAAPSVTVAATPASATMKAGEKAVFSLLATGAGGLTGAASIAVTGPAGITATASGPVTLGTAVNVTVTAAANLAAGTYALTATVRAGPYKASTPLTLVIAAGPAFTFKATAPSVPVKTGTTTAIALQITRAAGFTGPVTVTPQGLPAGVTAAPVTIASGATTANLALRVAASAAGGATPIALTATGGSPVTTATAKPAITVEKPASLTLAFQSPAFSAKAGTPVSMDFTVAASTTPASMRFSLLGMPGPAMAMIQSSGAGAYKLIIYTPASWSGKTATLQLALQANGLTASATTKLRLTP